MQNFLVIHLFLLHWKHIVKNSNFAPKIKVTPQQQRLFILCACMYVYKEQNAIYFLQRSTEYDSQIIFLSYSCVLSCD